MKWLKFESMKEIFGMPIHIILIVAIVQIWILYAVIKVAVRNGMLEALRERDEESDNDVNGADEK